MVIRPCSSDVCKGPRTPYPRLIGTLTSQACPSPFSLSTTTMDLRGRVGIFRGTNFSSLYSRTVEIFSSPGSEVFSSVHPFNCYFGFAPPIINLCWDLRVIIFIIPVDITDAIRWSSVQTVSSYHGHIFLMYAVSSQTFWLFVPQ